MDYTVNIDKTIQSLNKQLLATYQKTFKEAFAQQKDLSDVISQFTQTSYLKMQKAIFETLQPWQSYLDIIFQTQNTAWFNSLQNIKISIDPTIAENISKILQIFSSQLDYIRHIAPPLANISLAPSPLKSIDDYIQISADSLEGLEKHYIDIPSDLCIPVGKNIFHIKSEFFISLIFTILIAIMTLVQASMYHNQDSLSSSEFENKQLELLENILDQVTSSNNTNEETIELLQELKEFIIPDNSPDDSIIHQEQIPVQESSDQDDQKRIPVQESPDQSAEDMNVPVNNDTDTQ